MKILLNMMCIASVTFLFTPSFSQVNPNLFFCKANSNIKNLALVGGQIIYKPDKIGEIYLTNKEFVITDTIKMKDSWGFFNSINRISEKSAIISFANHGLLTTINTNKFNIIKEVKFSDYSFSRLGMKVPFENFVIGTGFENSKLKNSTGMYYSVVLPNSQLIQISKPQSRKTKYYTGMTSYTDYKLIQNDLIINYSETNTFIVYDTIKHVAKTYQFPAIVDKKNERWVYKQDFEYNNSFILHERKSMPTDVFRFDLKSNRINYITSIDFVVQFINGGNIYYKSEDDNGNICMYKMPLVKISKDSTPIVLKEVIIGENK